MELKEPFIQLKTKTKMKYILKDKKIFKNKKI